MGGTAIATRPGIIVYATLAMLAFAANSVLCRIALRQALIDPATFSSIRLIAGATMLLLISLWRGRPTLSGKRSLISAALLAFYAIPFSFAYMALSVGTGALILFACVQVTMLVAAIRFGEHVHFIQWIGVGCALLGLIYLVLPALATPSLLPAVLMAGAGVAWGLYSRRGRGITNPLVATTVNFVWAVPFALVASAIAWPHFHAEHTGVLLAVASGAIASGCGYVAWYAALPGLTGVQAAVLQLSVPVIAAAGGVIFLSEAVSIRLVLSTMLILGGIALATVVRRSAGGAVPSARRS